MKYYQLLFINHCYVQADYFQSVVESITRLMHCTTIKNKGRLLLSQIDIIKETV